VGGALVFTEITVFKSVGASLEDLAAAIEVWEQVSLKELD